MGKKTLLKKIIICTLTVWMGAGIFGRFGGILTPSLYGAEDAEKGFGFSDKQVSAPATPPEVSAEGAVLMDGETGEILWEKNGDKKLYPASTTKIMTTLVALEKLEELELGTDSQVVIPQEAEGVEGSSLYLKAGEKLTMEELLYGLMLQSGNDGAAAVAVCIGGSMENFVDMMNRKALELGCTGTSFTNPSGLFDENHYTTARDLALISAAAMEREDFRRIAGTRTWSSPGSGRSFTNKNKTIFQYEGATGIKIGFTEKSGRTLAASASRSGHQLIAVVLRDGNWFNDAYRLLDYGFSLYEDEKEGGYDGV